jgi:hypothetical protein
MGAVPKNASDAAGQPDPAVWVAVGSGSGVGVGGRTLVLVLVGVALAVGVAEGVLVGYSVGLAEGVHEGGSVGPLNTGFSVAVGEGSGVAAGRACPCGRRLRSPLRPA